jgi:hypothetical protein
LKAALGVLESDARNGSSAAVTHAAVDKLQKPRIGVPIERVRADRAKGNGERASQDLAPEPRAFHATLVGGLSGYEITEEPEDRAVERLILRIASKRMTFDELAGWFLR